MDIPEKEMSEKPTREKMQDEWKKIKSMGWKQRFVYFWDYYKIVIVIVIALIAAIQIGRSVWKSIHTEELLNAVFINSGYYLGDPAEMEEAFAEYLGGLEKDQAVSLDFSLNMGQGSVDNMSMAAQTKILANISTRTLDAMVMDEYVFGQYSEEDLYCNLDKMLTEEEKEAWKDRLVVKETDQGEAVTAVLLNGTWLLEKYFLFEGEDAYFTIIGNSERQEMALEFLRFLMKEESTGGQNNG